MVFVGRTCRSRRRKERKLGKHAISEETRHKPIIKLDVITFDLKTLAFSMVVISNDKIRRRRFWYDNVLENKRESLIRTKKSFLKAGRKRVKEPAVVCRLAPSSSNSNHSGRQKSLWQRTNVRNGPRPQTDSNRASLTGLMKKETPLLCQNSWERWLT